LSVSFVEPKGQRQNIIVGCKDAARFNPINRLSYVSVRSSLFRPVIMSWPPTTGPSAREGHYSAAPTLVITHMAPLMSCDLEESLGCLQRVPTIDGQRKMNVAAIGLNIAAVPLGAAPPASPRIAQVPVADIIRFTRFAAAVVA
jgi:hypothetical protein